MKAELKKAPIVSESRKIRKPLMEKIRRARINDSLETLKQILLESNSTLQEDNGKGGQRTAKLEKADILEMTVKYVQALRTKIKHEDTENHHNELTKNVQIRPADSSSPPNENFKLTLVNARLHNGKIAFIMPLHENVINKNEISSSTMNVWRPW